MTETKTKDVETPPGYPEGWQPEEIRTIEVQPLPKDQQPDPVLTPEQGTEWNRIQSLYPHDHVLIVFDEDGEPTFVEPEGVEPIGTPPEDVPEPDEEEPDAEPEPEPEPEEEPVVDHRAKSSRKK